MAVNLAVVEPRPGAAPTLEELAEHCRTKVARYEVPRELHLVGAMPRHPSGEPDDRRAEAIAEDHAATDHPADTAEEAKA